MTDALDLFPLAQAMRDEAIARYPSEACGLIVGGLKRAEFVPCRNVTAKDPTRNFSIDRGERDRIRQEHGEIIGVWHSHPDTSPKPSPADIASCNAGGIPWYIVGVWRDDVLGEMVVSDIEIVHPSDSAPDYVGRPYIYGKNDCYSLCVDYYRREYGMEILSHDGLRVTEWWAKGHNFFVDHFNETGFVRLIGQEPQPGDLFLMQVGADVPNHIGVYIGDDQFIHHPHNRLSRRDVYGGFWHKHTTHHLRHRSFVNEHG